MPVDEYGNKRKSTGSDEEIKAAVALAKAKGWKSICLTGTDDFKCRAWLEAFCVGFLITGYAPSPDLVSQPTKEKKAMQGTPAAGGASLLMPHQSRPRSSRNRRWMNCWICRKNQVSVLPRRIRCRNSISITWSWLRDSMRQKFGITPHILAATRDLVSRVRWRSFRPCASGSTSSLR